MPKLLGYFESMNQKLLDNAINSTSEERTNLLIPVPQSSRQKPLTTIPLLIKKTKAFHPRKRRSSSLVQGPTESVRGSSLITAVCMD